MRRRDFVISIGGAAAAWPLPARTQQAPMPVIGLLSGRALKHSEVAAFRKGLAEAGYVEGRNVAIEYRSADNQYDRLPALAAELDDRFHETDHIGCHHSFLVTGISQEHPDGPILVGIRFEPWKRPTSSSRGGRDCRARHNIRSVGRQSGN
jgi:hypothetical protein